MTVKEKLDNTVTEIVNTVSGVAQAEIDRANVPKIITEGMPELVREAAAEGAVLLKNNGVLPLENGTRLSLFSRVAESWFYVGYGSGGDVNRPYEVNLCDGIRNCDTLELNEELAKIYEEWGAKHPINHGIWGTWPFYYPDMPLNEEIVNEAKEKSDAAIVIIGRSSGEDRDCALEKGSYYLTDDEVKTLDLVCNAFDKVIVLFNVGGIMDMSVIESYGDKISAIMYVWQGGMESGNAVADLLSGKVAPSGRLTDTIARDYSDYPSSDNFGNKDIDLYAEDIYLGYRYFETFEKDKVIYPFGFGLSYTDFEIKHIETKALENGFEVKASVKNTGKTSAKEVVQLYVEKPCGELGNPSRELIGFAKTDALESGQEQEVCIYVDPYQLTSYDDCGASGHEFCDVTLEGEYSFYLGKNVRDAKEIFTYYQSECEVYSKHRQAAPPVTPLEILCANDEDGRRVKSTKAARLQKYDLASRIINNLPKDIEQTGDLGYKLIDVKNGKVTMEQFVAQLSLDELEAITRGDYNMDSPLGAKGNAGAFAGVLESLREKGVPAVITTDGPSGIRLQSCCSLLPIGTLLACSFNTDLVEKLYTAIAKEMKDRGSDVLLGPGVNIHRNALCGRNFEYFSEDPYLTGKMAAAFVRGIQSGGLSACPKHFACNNQEYKRTEVDSRLSERALREIYLKGFEICINDSEPKNIMTSYNKVNGVWSHYHYDLCTTILRGEWGYKGNVITDWWMKSSKSPEFPNICDQAYRVRAQVDVLMPGAKRIHNGKPDGTLLKSYKNGSQYGITLGEMQRCAMNVLRAAIEIKL